MDRVERDHVVEDRLDGFGYESLQEMGFDGQPKAGHFGHVTRVAGDCEGYFPGVDLSARCFDADDRSAVPQVVRHLAVLDDVNAKSVGSASIAPCHRVVPYRAGALLPEPSKDRKPCAVGIIQNRHLAPHFLPRQKLRIDAIQSHDVAAPRRTVHLRGGMAQVDLATRGVHDVEVQILAEALPKLQRLLVEPGVAVDHVVRSNDRRITASIAATDVVFLEHGDVADAVVLGEVIGGGKTVPAAAHDYDIVRGLGVGIPPRARPTLVPAKGIPEQAERRVAHRLF